MQLKATVHSAAPTDVLTDLALADGTTITAKVPMLVVELVTDDPDQKNPMFNAPMADAAMFETGARVTITIAPETEIAK